jgi:chromosome segregation ATPase
MSQSMTNMNINKNDNDALRELTSGQYWFIKDRHVIAVQKLVEALLNRDQKVLENIDKLEKLRKDKTTALEQQSKESANQVASLRLQLENYKKHLQNRDQQLKEKDKDLNSLTGYIAKLQNLGVKQREDVAELESLLQTYRTIYEKLHNFLLDLTSLDPNKVTELPGISQSSPITPDIIGNN